MPPRRKRFPSLASRIDPSRYRLLPDHTPGPLGYRDAYDPTLDPDDGWTLQPRSLVEPTDRIAHLHIMSPDEMRLSVAGEELLAQPEYDLLKKKIASKDVRDYFLLRQKVFGSSRAYDEFAIESDKELEETKGLRRLIELGGKTDKDKRRQNVFYRWVRKAYIDRGVTNVPGLIKAGMSDELKAALAEVREGYGGSFSAGGFNPRPMKDGNYRYRLGTLSEHALGSAIDINEKSNPIFTAKEWAFVETFVGKKVDRSTRRWKDSPEDLWKAVKELNDLFVEKVKEELLAAVMESVKPGATPPKPGANPLEPILPKQEKLQKYSKGFFALPWKLVEQLHAHGFKWGVTFGSVDLHHFELD